MADIASVTASTALKRLGIAFAVIVVAGLGILLATSVLIPADRVREAVKAEIRAVTGLDLVLRGNVSVSLFPSGAVSFDDVALGEDRVGKPALAVDTLTARLRFFPLLTGHIEIADVSLTRPRIFIDLRGGGRSNWSGLVAALAHALKPSASRADSFSEIRISGGTILIHDDKHKLDERLDDVEMSLAWPSISKSFAATGRLNWRGETLTTTLSVGDFLAALAGARSSLKLRLAGTPLNLAFDGHMSYLPTLKIDGGLTADANSLRDAMLWAGHKLLPGGGFNRFALKAQTDIVGGTVSLSKVNVELDGNSAEGVLTFATDGREVLQGTLAADSIDLTPYVSTVRLLTASDRSWSRMPVALDSLEDFDLDLRLSAAKVKLASASLGRTAIATNLSKGQLTVTVGESQAFDGVIKGYVTLANSRQGATFKSQLQFSDVDLDNCLGAVFGLHRVQGKGDLSFAIEGNGDSVMDITRTLGGQATLVSGKGALVGINVEQLLRRLEQRPLSRSSAYRTGRTPFKKLTVTIKISQGTATVEDMKIEGDTVRLALAGSASIPTRDLDLKGTAVLAPAAAGKDPFTLPFFVQGPWDDPVMLPDVQSLIRRSGAAAPLLDAVRSHRAREAARKTTKQLNGSAVKPAAAPAAVPPSTAAAPANPQ
jgi:AsmA protein